MQILMRLRRNLFFYILLTVHIIRSMITSSGVINETCISHIMAISATLLNDIIFVAGPNHVRLCHQEGGFCMGEISVVVNEFMRDKGVVHEHYCRGESDRYDR